MAGVAATLSFANAHLYMKMQYFRTKRVKMALYWFGANGQQLGPAVERIFEGDKQQVFGPNDRPAGATTVTLINR
jgi:hypothetical protein